MKNIWKSIFYIAAGLLVISCAKAVSEGANEASQRYFDAWMSLNHPDLKGTWNGEDNPNGIYIFPADDIEGTGKTVEKDGYVIVDYITYDLEGNISEYTDAATARQLGEYDPSTYYGSQVWLTYDGAIASGVQNALLGMKEGGKRKVIIPSWLMTYSTYDTAEKYLEHSGDFTNCVYEFTVKAYTDSIEVWQRDSIERYIVKNYGGISTFANDTTGFYMRHNVAVSSDAQVFPEDTTIYVNYTGKLLNGLVFDTTSERIAKDNDIYDPTKEYAPVKITWGESYSEITMGNDGSSVITGFAMILSKMKYKPDNAEWKDSCTGIFDSVLGYGYSGSGASIPGYAPLIFEIEVVDAPEE